MVKQNCSTCYEQTSSDTKTKFLSCRQFKKKSRFESQSCHKHHLCFEILVYELYVITSEHITTIQKTFEYIFVDECAQIINLVFTFF